MSQQCEICSTVVFRRIYIREQNKMIGVDCGCARRPQQLGDSTKSAFEIKFDHVKDEFGHNLQVSNIRELERAEKRLGFQSVVLHSDAQNFDDPPQQRKMDMAAVHRWRYSNESRFRESHGR